jgi:glycerol-3-phosphate dehydrogenase
MVSLGLFGRRPAPAHPTGSDVLNASRRAADLAALADGEVVDVLVVGGGITGAWVALDAASRGLSVALVERGDLAQGTSRWSSKLAHGGLRYLAHGEVDLAWEAARERAVLMDVSAPHLIRALPMLLPLGDHVGRAAGVRMETGIRLGDRLRSAAGTSRRRLPPARRISAEEARRLAPELSDRNLRGAILHWDGQIEDDARLVIAVARTAAAHGARILTYARASDLRGDGATVHDELAGAAAFAVRARHVVNATGVWAGELSPAVALRPSKGSHLLVPAARLGHPRAAVNAPLPGSGGSRFVFAVPRPDELVLIGITDDAFDGPIPDVPEVDVQEERFLLESIGRVLARPLTSADVVGRYAGLRPLLAGEAGATADLSRRHAVIEDEHGILTVVGGKLTTARKMAQDALDRVARRDGVAAGACATPRIALVGAGAPRDTAPAGVPQRLMRRYGAEAARVASLAIGDPTALEPIAPGVPVSRAELRFAVTHELALTVEDLLDRRTRLGLVPAWRAAALDAARELLDEPLAPAA